MLDETQSAKQAVELRYSYISRVVQEMIILR